MRRVTIFIISSMILLLPMTQLVSADEEGDETDRMMFHPFYKDPDNRTSMTMEEKISFFFENRNPGFNIRGSNLSLGFSFGIIELIHQNNKGIDKINLSEGIWNMSFDVINRTFLYRTNAIWKNTGILGSNRTDISLRFRPIWEEGIRRLEYNISLMDNITKGDLILRWMFSAYDYFKPSPDMDFERFGKPRFHDHKLLLNDSEGRDIASVMWEKRAKLLFDNGSRLVDISPQDSVENEEVLVVEQKIEVESGVMGVESSGYIEILDAFIDAISEAGEDVVSYTREHIYSLLIGCLVVVSLIIPSILIMGRIRGKREPEQDLNYRNSKFFRN